MSLQVKQREQYEDNNWWSWSVWVDGPDSELDQITHVEYTLHPSFYEPVRKVSTRENKFKLAAEGWGVFTIYVQVVKKDSSVISLRHELALHYPDGTPNTL